MLITQNYIKDDGSNSNPNSPLTSQLGRCLVKVLAIKCKEGSLTVVGLKDTAITGFSEMVKKMGIFRLRVFLSTEVAEALEPKLLKGVAVYVVRTRPDLLLQ